VTVTLQDPVVFSGTVRDNLDPFNACDGDAAIWSALRQTGMADTVNNLQVCSHLHMVDSHSQAQVRECIPKEHYNLNYWS